MDTQTDTFLQWDSTTDTSRAWMHLKGFISEKGHLKRSHTARFHLYDILEKTKWWG